MGAAETMKGWHEDGDPANTRFSNVDMNTLYAVEATKAVNNKATHTSDGLMTLTSYEADS